VVGSGGAGYVRTGWDTMSDTTAGTEDQRRDGAEPESAPKTATFKESPSNTPVAATELRQTDAGNIEATTVTMDRSGAEQITAERVVMTQSGVMQMEARSAQLERSGVVNLKSEHVVLQGGTAFSVAADDARLVKSRAIAVVSGQTYLEGDARALLVVGPVALADHAHVPAERDDPEHVRGLAPLVRAERDGNHQRALDPDNLHV